MTAHRVGSSLLAALALWLAVAGPAAAEVKRKKKPAARRPAVTRPRDPAALSAEKRKAEEALKEKKRREQELRSELKDTVVQEKQVLAELDAIDRRIAGVRAEIRSFRDEIESTKAQLTAMGRQQRVTEGEMARAGDRLRQNLLVIQQADPEERVADVALLCATGEAERLSTARLTRHELQFRAVRQAENLSRQRRLQAGLVAKESELQNMRGQRARLRDRFRRDKGQKAAMLRESESSRREFERFVYRLEHEQREQRQARAVAGTARPVLPARPLASRAGQLLWPVRGPVLRGFGRQRHKIYNAVVVSTGIEIGAKEGTPVRSADAGEVLFADWMQGFGRVMIVGHGSEFMTVYGHLSELAAAKGQRVSRGAVIATTGDTGTLGAPSLYFEVRPQGGQARNPLPYLGREE